MFSGIMQSSYIDQGDASNNIQGDHLNQFACETMQGLTAHLLHLPIV